MTSREWGTSRDPPQLEEDALPRSSKSGPCSGTLHYSTLFDLRRRRRYGRTAHDCQSLYIQLPTLFMSYPVATTQLTARAGESFLPPASRRPGSGPATWASTAAAARACSGARPDAAHNAASQRGPERGRASRALGPAADRGDRTGGAVALATWPPRGAPAVPETASSRPVADRRASAQRRERRPSSSTPVVAAVATPNPRCWASDCR